MPDPRPAPYDGRHTRTTSWSTAREMRLNNEPQRAPFRRRDSDASSHSVSDTVPARRSVEWRHHHARSVSQSQTNVQALQEQELPPSSNKPARVTWMSLPRKGQLALLGLCRVFDFLQIASLQAYMFYQLKSFDETLSDSEVSTQAGILQGAFTAAQFATAIPWGRVADAQWGGRKFVLLVGLIGTAVSCLGVAFATSFAQAVFWRSFGGAINGTVGIIRTMIAENVKEKKYHSRAFLILPIGFNIAALFGPGKDASNDLDVGGSDLIRSHGRSAVGPREELSKPVWTKLALWRSHRGAMADEVPIRAAHVGELYPSDTVCGARGSRLGRGMFAEIGIY
mgnify:CR=1 FL=1